MSRCSRAPPERRKLTKRNTTGNSVSSALIEGVARAGDGFAQSVGEGETLDGKVIRMLRGALTPGK